MARAIYRINEFIGIDQSRDENALKSAMSPDACNMDTAGGNLSVCRGCVRHIEAPIPGTGDIHAIRIFSTPDGEMFIAAAGESIYAYKNGSVCPPSTFGLASTLPQFSMLLPPPGSWDQ